MKNAELSIENSVDMKQLQPFIWVGLGWLVLGAVVCFVFSSTAQPPIKTFGWMALIWAFCLLDLYALARAVGAVLGLTTMTGKKRGALVIQASYWGVIKLACLGILGLILLRSSTIPTLGMVLGSSTLIVTPLLGGYWWSQKVLRHA
ncbi:hypothetical protein WDW37_09925 [Bdellovibrionota bacterium FG-1]